MAAALHGIQTWTGWTGQEAEFDPQEALARYERLSGGDNGLSDDQIYPAWRTGLLPVDGPHKILDYLAIDPTNDTAIRLGLYLFCGGTWTCSLLDTWLENPSPGDEWTDGGQPDPNAGHAMHLSGFDERHYFSETWGFDPPIRLTPAGLRAADPEVVVEFSLDMFDKAGICPANGLNYKTLSALWTQLGGRTLQPDPFPPAPPPPPPPPNPPTPPVPPNPPVPAEGWSGSIEVVGGILKAVISAPAPSEKKQK